MKLLLFSSTKNPLSGYGNITDEICRFFLHEKVSFTLLLPTNQRENQKAAYPVEYILPPYIYNLKTPKVFDYLSFSYTNREFDVIFSLFEFPYALLASRLAQKNHLPLVIGTQGTYAISPLFHFPEKWFLKDAYNQAARIIAPSSFTKNTIIKYSQTQTPIEIIHNGINFARFQQKTTASQIKKQYRQKKILLTVGDPKPRKGQDLVISALHLLSQNRQDFQYLIIGNPQSWRSYLDSLIVQFTLTDQVSFLGYKKDRELVSYFQAADVYVHTPRMVDWDFEGFGIVYLEASACGKPIVAARSGGVEDAVIDGKTGLLVPENDIEGIASAIDQLFSSPKLAAKLGSNGQEYARKHDWSIIGKKYLNLLKSVAK